jgi:hypothetical protein
MAGFDTRGGKPSNYVLGRGKLYLSGDISRTFNLVNPTADSNRVWRDLGNVTGFTVTQESETKEHRSSLQGLQVVDLEVPVSQKMTIGFVLDEINANNLARFMSGSYLGADNDDGATVPALGNGARIASDNVTLMFAAGDRNFFVETLATDQVWDVWYDLELRILSSGTFPCIDFEPQGTGANQQNIRVRHAVIDNVDTATGGTLMAEGTNYEIDRQMGRIRFSNTGHANDIARGDNFVVYWDAQEGVTLDYLDTELFAIQPLSTSGVTVRVKFIQENANDGDKPLALEFWQVKLKPDGEYAGIGDDWAQLAFTGVVESIDTPEVFGSPYGRILGRNSFKT